MLKSLIMAISGIILISSISYSDNRNILLLNDPYKDSSKKFYNALKTNLSNSNTTLTEIEINSLSNVLDQFDGKGSILVLPNAVSFPAEAKDPLIKFLKQGNHLFAISGPPFSNITINADGKHVSVDELDEIIANQSGNTVIDFSKTSADKWIHASGSPQHKTDFIIENADNDISSASLHVKISKLDDWNTFALPKMSNLFNNDETITTFAAKGGPNTSELLIEWREKDGSRWMYGVKLTKEWKRYAIKAGDFTLWPDGSPANRGGSKDSFKPINAEQFTVGLSNSLQTLKMGVSHEYWISDVKAVKNIYSANDLRQPIFESLSPQYKTYPTSVEDIISVNGEKIASAKDKVWPSIQRPLGYGSNTIKKTRQIPILYAYDKDGGNRGMVGHLFLNTLGEFAGSIWGYLGISQKDLDNDPNAVIPTIVSMIDRINGGVFLSNAGTEFFAYTPDESISTGAYLYNLSGKSIDVNVISMVIADRKTIKRNSKSVVLSSAPKPSGVFFGSENLSPGIYESKTIITIDNKTVDEITYEFQVIDYKKVTKKNTVVLSGPDFMLNGKKWYPLGMNYWPRYSVGLEPIEYYLHWLSPDQYDPKMIEADLAQAESLGMNVLSVQYVKQDQSRPLMDFMARAEKHGIKLHVFMSGVHPLYPDLPAGKELIQSAHLYESPAMWCYDLGWEVNVGPYNSRKQFDKEWYQWVIDRYGSIDNACADWKYDAEMINDVLTGPKDNQLMNDGDWRIFVAAYRLFWDDRISKGYRIVREGIREIDKVHLMGARSGYGGTGAVWIADKLPFDLLSGAKHIDFISPEAYNIGGDRRGFLIGGFHGSYGRHFGGNKPIFWAEYGSPLFFNLETLKFKNEYNDEQYEKERAYYEGIINMTIDTFANGSAGWWWPGGMRVDEKSDFGIINPDGTPRPAALVFKKMAEKFYKPRTVFAPDAWIDIDRDRYVTGYAGVFADASPKYVDLLDEGKTPGVRTPGSGTTSVNVPLIAAGNVPYNGKNPLKYMNSEFNWIKINGKIIKNGDVITVKKNKIISIEASMGNTNEAKWIAPGNTDTGTVYLSVSCGNETHDFPIKEDTEFLSDAVIGKSVLIKEAIGKYDVIFRMKAKDRAEFGEVIRITINSI